MTTYSQAKRNREQSFPSFVTQQIHAVPKESYLISYKALKVHWIRIPSVLRQRKPILTSLDHKRMFQNNE